jgi:hypothetical protein
MADAVKNASTASKSGSQRHFSFAFHHFPLNFKFVQSGTTTKCLILFWPVVEWVGPTLGHRPTLLAVCCKTKYKTHNIFGITSSFSF